MSKLDNLTDFLASHADKIRAKLGTTTKINPQDFDSKVDEVYDAGYGKAEGEIAELNAEITTLTEQKQTLEAEVNSQIELRLEAEAEAKMWKADAVAQNELRLEAEAQLPIKYNEGIEAEHFRFWDNLQNKGKRDNYKYGFWIWYNPYNIFYPVYDIYGDCFEAFRGWNTGTPFDVAQRLEDCGAKLNTKGTTDFSQFAAFATVITRFPELDATDATRAQSAFYSCTWLVTIDKFKVSEKLTNYTKCFKNCTALEKVIFEGIIAGNIDFSSCTKLSHDSIVSIINALSATTNGLTVTFSLDAVNKAFETSPGANDGSTSAEWAALVAAKPNWSIALA